MAAPALVPRVTYGSLELTAPPYALIFGSDFGGPEVVVQTLVTFLQDGEFEISDRSSNRTFTLPVLTEGLNLNALADAEQALVLEARKPLNTLTIDPGDGSTLPTVFDTFVGDVQFARDDEYEKNRLRVWNLTISALPYGRDQNLTTVQTVTPAPAKVDVQIASGGSTTGWTAADANGSPLSVSSNGASVSASSQTFQVSLRRTFATGSEVDVSSTRIIMFEWYPDHQSFSKGYVFAPGSTAGVEMVLLSRIQQSGGFSRSYFQIPESFGTKVGAVELQSQAIFAPHDALAISQVNRTNQVPGSGSGRQQSRSLRIGGSARARASLAVTADAGKTLGDLTMLYTRTATTGFQPPLRPYRFTSAQVQNDSSDLVSGAFNSLGTPMVFLVPANRISEAMYGFVARLRATAAGTYSLSYTVQLVSNANDTIPESAPTASGSVSVSFSTANVWQNSDLGTVQLPTVPVASDSTHVLRVTLSASSSVVQVDEAWWFDLDHGVLSWVNSTGLTRLEARTADLTLPRPSFWGGTADGGAAVRLSRADFRVVSYGVHVFEPGLVDVFTVTSGTEAASASAAYYRAWHTHARASADGLYTAQAFGDQPPIAAKTTGLESS